MFQSQGGQRQDQHSHIPEGKVVSVAETVSTAERPCVPPALRLYSSPLARQTHPSLTSNSLTFASGWLRFPGPAYKKKKSLPAQLGSAQLGSVQPFSYTRPALHLCE